MKDQVVIAKKSGMLAVAVPLYRIGQTEELESMGGYTIAFTANEPCAYVLDMGFPQAQLVSAEFLEKHVEFLGDL